MATSNNSSRTVMRSLGDDRLEEPQRLVVSIRELSGQIIPCCRLFGTGIYMDELSAFHSVTCCALWRKAAALESTV